MATIIDELFVRLGIDATQFKKGSDDAQLAFKKTKDEALKGGKEIEKANKQLGEMFVKIRNELLGLVAALIGGREIKQFLTDINSVNLALGNLSANTGVAPERIDAWEKAVRRAGGSASDAAASIRAANNAINELKVNGGYLTPELQKLAGGFDKIGSADFLTALQKGDPLEVIERIADQAKKLADAGDSVKAHWLLNQSGMFNEWTSDLAIKKGGKGIAEELKQIASETGPTAAAIKAAGELHSNWAQLQDDATKLGSDLDANLDPPISRLLVDLHEWFQANKSIIEQDFTAWGQDQVDSVKNLEKFPWTKITDDAKQLAGALNYLNDISQKAGKSISEGHGNFWEIFGPGFAPAENSPLNIGPKIEQGFKGAIDWLFQPKKEEEDTRPATPVSKPGPPPPQATGGTSSRACSTSARMPGNFLLNLDPRTSA